MKPTKEMIERAWKAFGETSNLEKALTAALEGYELAPFELTEEEEHALELAEEDEDNSVWRLCRMVRRAQKTLVAAPTARREITDADVKREITVDEVLQKLTDDVGLYGKDVGLARAALESVFAGEAVVQDLRDPKQWIAESFDPEVRKKEYESVRLLLDVIEAEWSR